MGAGQSSSAGGEVVDDLESKLRGSGGLKSLEEAFRCLSQSESSSETIDKHCLVPTICLQKCFGLAPLSVKKDGSSEASQIMAYIGPAIVSELYDSKDEKVEWTQFLEGYQKCTADTGAEHLKTLFSVFFRASRMAQEVSKQQSKALERKEEETTGFDVFTGAQLRDFFYICWLLMCHTRLPTKGSVVESGATLEVSLPGIDFLLSAAVSACEMKSEGDKPQEQSGLETVLSISEISSWILTTIPALTESLVRYVRAKLAAFPALSKVSVEEKHTSAESTEDDEVEISPQDKEEEGLSKKDGLLLHSGTAWAVGLSFRDSAAAEVLFRASCGIVECADSDLPTLLYRSSIHGRGLNRFWTCVDGYHAPVLVLISAHAEGDSSPGPVFVVGALVSTGFLNKELPYGASGSCLYSVQPLFCPFRTSGKDKYYVYSHKRTPGAVYRAQPAIEGVGFGGSYGKERVWLDQDFATLTVRHHAVDKTYHSGGLVPGQGFSPVTARVLDIEIWGLGGQRAEEEQAKFLKRENLFSEQRRKVDLASFGNWENSPEKMMMEMMSDPNAAGREER